MSQMKIMIVDDDEKILYAFKEVIKKDGYICIEARDGKEALQKLAKEQPTMIFMDITMPRLDGLKALQRIKEENNSTPVVIITGHGTMQTAVKAMQLGAFEYLTKPLSIAKIRKTIDTVRKSHESSIAEPVQSDANIMDRYELVGNSLAMQEVYKLIGSITTTPNHTSVLLVGESGTGKELVARAIHNNSSNPYESFVGINCTALPENLLESELFGHEKGAFTGATDRKLGKFEAAGNGTLFLDEIGDVPPNLQQKLLRVLQEREFERLGGNVLIPVNARIIVATNRDLSEKVKSGVFREDLFYRLNVATIHLPPLREHPEDIPLLANYFLKRYNYHFKKSIKGFSAEAMSLLQSYSYPGNIRELKNLIERSVMLTTGDVILPDILREMFVLSTPKQTSRLPIYSPIFSESREHLLCLFEQQFISEQLAKHNGNISAAARASKMSRQNFHRLMVKHKIRHEPHS